MKSLYKRQLTMMVGIMILSFTLLSAAFMLLSYRYLISEKRDSLERNAGYIAGFTAVYYQEFRDIQDELYSSYVANIALISDSFVIVADRDGNIQYATDGSNIYTYRNAALPQSIVSQVIDGGGYAGLTTLGGIYPGQRYTAGLPVPATVLGKGGRLERGRDVVGHRHHLLLLGGGGAAHLGGGQRAHLHLSGPAPERDGRGRPEIRAGGFRRAGHRL